MFSMMKRPVIFGAMLLMLAMAMAQTQREREALSVQGYQGQATVIRNHGRVFVDVQDLAQITNGSLSFEKNRIILTLPVRTVHPRAAMLTHQDFRAAS